MTKSADEQEMPKPPRRIGVLGAGGQLGRCLVRQIESAPDLALAFAVTRKEHDLASEKTLSAEIDGLLSGPEEGLAEVVINAAAHTKVDLCETESALAYQVNALAPGEWARQLAERDIRFIHVSTDYVFPGDGERPYRESDATDPRTVYGASKRAGEIAVLGHTKDALVVRTAWVFGPGRNFVLAILDQAQKRRDGEATGPLSVVSDQEGSPTFAADLAFALLAVARQNREEWGGGLLHLRNCGETTWYGFAREILNQAGFSDIGIKPVPSSTFETAAKRPSYSVLDCSWAASKGIALPPWTDALTRYLASPDCPYDPVIPVEDPKAQASVSTASSPADSDSSPTTPQAPEVSR